jgi:hypothetical protein
MLARVIEGARYTLGVAFLATVLASGIGATLALLAAASGRWIDATLSRVLDTLTAIPSKMFALLMVAGFGSSVQMLIVTAAIIYVPGAYRMARALAVNINALDYVTVARARRRHRLRDAGRSCPTSPGRCWPTSDCASSTWCCCWSRASRPGRSAARGGLGLAGAREHRNSWPSGGAASDQRLRSPLPA